MNDNVRATVSDIMLAISGTIKFLRANNLISDEAERSLRLSCKIANERLAAAIGGMENLNKEDPMLASDKAKEEMTLELIGDGMTKTPAFREELRSLLNRHSIENGSNTPDFILATYLLGALLAMELVIYRREKWYGRNPQEGPAGICTGARKMGPFGLGPTVPGDR